MIDATAATLAFRNRAIGLTVATTGATSISATATGYARAAGSFLTDGFAVGMEITSVTGFSTAGNNQATSAQGRIITGVTATAIACAGCAVEAAVTATITVGLPFQRSWENVAFRPVNGFPYIEETFVPGTATMVTIPYANGRMDEDGLYVLKWYGLPGHDMTALRKCTDALRARFTPGTTLTAGADAVRVRGTPAGPQVGGFIPLASGWVVAPLTVPWYAQTQNLVAA